MNKEERKEKIAELRKYHEGILGTIKDAYFACKHAHYPDDMPDEKCIGLFASEIGKGDDVYLEFVTMDYTPSDSTRRLYVWRHQSDYVTRYKQNKKTGQYLIPVAELHVVSTIHDNRIEPELESEAPKIYTKTETIEVTYKELTYVGLSGARIKLTLRGEEVFEYAYSTERGKEPCTKLSGIELKETWDFFKLLKL